MKRDTGPEAAAAANERDLATLRRLRSEAGAFEALYREFYPRLFDFLLRMLGSPRDVEEAINDTMLVVWRKADDFAERSKVSTWIFGIAYKKALKRLQWNRRLAEREVQVDIEAVSPYDPVEIVGDEALLARIRVAVGQLPLAQRSIVHLAFFYGYSYSEIAEIVDCPVNTVKTRMYYARERLRPLLDAVLSPERRHESS